MGHFNQPLFLKGPFHQSEAGVLHQMLAAVFLPAARWRQSRSRRARCSLLIFSRVSLEGGGEFSKMIKEMLKF